MMYTAKTPRKNFLIYRMLVMLLATMLAMTLISSPTLGNAQAKNEWITFPNIDAKLMATSDDADRFVIMNPLDFDDDNNIVIPYSVSGQQWHRCALLWDENGNPLVQDGSGGADDTLYGDNGIILHDSMEKNRTVALSGLQEDTTYQLYWGKLAANGRNPQCDVILTFTTGHLTWDYDFTKDMADRTGKRFAWNQAEKTLVLSGVEDSDAGIILPDGATVELETDKVNQVTSIIGRGSLIIQGDGALHVGEIGSTEEAIYASDDLTIQGGTIVAKGSKIGIVTGGNITIHGGALEATGIREGAVLARGGSLTFDDSMEITTPAKGEGQGGRVVDQEGATATEAAIEGKGVHHRVNFDSNGGTAVATQIVAEGEVARVPSAPSKTEYKLLEWQCDGTAYDFSTPITRDITLKAIWQLSGPKQNWIQSISLDADQGYTPAASFYDHSDVVEGVKTDYYLIKEPLEFDDAGMITIGYGTSGQKDYAVSGLTLRNAEGQVIGKSDDQNDQGVIQQTLGSFREVKVSGVAGKTTYQIYWPQKAVRDRNPRRDVVLTFTTASRNEGAFRVFGVNQNYSYTGQAIKPTPMVTLDGEPLKENKDYTVSYIGDTINAGTVTLRVNGMGMLAGWEKVLTYDIIGIRLTSEHIQLPAGVGRAEDGTVQYSYTGSPIKPDPVVTYGGATLVKGKDYQVNYWLADSPWTEATEKKLRVTVSGVGNYFGAVIQYYIIVPMKVLPTSELDNESRSTGSDMHSTNPDNQRGSDGTALGKGASAVAAEKAITSMKSDADPAGSKFAPLMLKSTKQTKKSEKVTWKKVSGAKKYVLYGNKCGKNNKMKKIKTTTKNNFNVKKIAGKKLKKKTYYQYIVIALDANNNVVSTSKVIHVATKGSKKKTNHKSVKVTKSKKARATVKVGKTTKIKAKAVKAKKTTVKKHRVLSYESSNTYIVTVSKKGVIKGKKKGTAKIYVYAQNGVSKTVKVTVK